MLRIIAIVVILVLVCAGFYAFHERSETHPSGPSAALHLSEGDFDAQIAQHPGVVLVDFWAEWCGPCRELAPIVEEIAVDYKGRMSVAKVDVDKSPNLAKRFDISGIPLLVLLKDGKLIDQRVGVQEKAKLIDWIESALKK